MKTVFPNYLSEFKCSASACKHTCCAGWEIDIDPDSLERFRNFPDIMEHVDTDQEVPCFRLRDHDICPFLNEQGLCDMIIAHGEEMLCGICADHPRFMNYLSDRVEIGLGMCCEEAARLILSASDPFSLVEENDGSNCDLLSEDESYVLSIRNSVFNTLADRSIPVAARIDRILEDSQCRLPELTDAAIFEIFASMERLEDSWNEKLLPLRSDNKLSLPASTIKNERVLENLAFYFFYRHLSPAAYDETLSGRLKLCAFLWYAAATLITVNALDDFDSILDLCRRFSCEIEYSDENIEQLLDILDLE